MELKQSSQIDPKESIVFLLYSRYCHYCKYSHQYTKERTEKEKKYFYGRLIKEYILNQWQLLYLEWAIEKIKKLEPLVDPTSFILRENLSHDYLVHLSDCFYLYVW